MNIYLARKTDQRDGNTIIHMQIHSLPTHLPTHPLNTYLHTLQ
jgi:hypothetical protein